PQYVEELQDRGTEYDRLVMHIPRRYQRMRGGDKILIDGREWEVIIGLGHSPEHACLYCDELKVMCSGDQILPRITPIIGVHPMEPDDNPLQFFVDNLGAFRHLAHDTLVLPAHGLPFRGVHARLDYMREHHRDRLIALLRAGTEPITARQGVDVLFDRELDAQEIRLATMETLSHANMLIARGDMARTEREDGVWLYQTTESGRATAG
ncbi:MAG: MBL fold metallo-hydrolase, partial [Alphaproteobacteria bacterium]